VAESSDARPRYALWAGAAALVALVAFSEYLALNRILQVDELQNIYTSRLLAKHLEHQYSAYASLMFFGPMGWLAGGIERSALIFRAERLLFFALFWVNLALIVRCAGIRLRSRAGVLSLLIVGTLAPLWDYGFEVRHDNALLTTILLAWIAARPLGENAKRSLFAVGFIAVIAQFVAYKAFAYLLPIVFFALVAAIVEERRPVHAVLRLLAGVAAATVLSVSIHLLEGTWTLYTSNFSALGKAATEAQHMPSVYTFYRVWAQSPLLVMALPFALAVAVGNLVRGKWVGRDSLVPETCLAALAAAALMVNPTPYPYNLVLVVPYAAILLLRLAPRVTRLWQSNLVWKGAFTIALVMHLATWFDSTRRHVDMSNARQVQLMTMAEEMTDPRVHAVFDGSGLVPTRRPPGFHWLIHGFSIQYFRDGSFGRIRDQLAEGRTPVVIPNYRTSWLPGKDQQFIAQHYMPLAGDYWVAGTMLESGLRSGAGEWECIVPGRYFVASDRAGATVTLDGQTVAPGVLTVARGPHRVTSTASRTIVAWLGPKLEKLPAMGPGRPDQVFVNWY
jgi:hypothetical protein